MSEPVRESTDAGRSVGPYHLIRAIGAGGSARIDLARIDRAYNFQRHVVIKRPLEHLRSNAGVAASLRREARIGGMLRHPNLVAVLDAGVHDGYDYLVLEYVHGTSLRALMETETGGTVRDVPIAVALGIAIDVSRALHDAHELVDDRGSPLGLVHRDVSPGNVLLGLDGAVKLADFGIAKETRVSTLSGSMHGTVTYMAPEQCRGHAFDRRADIFSIGVILYELVTRVRLFWADNDVASLHRVLSGHIAPPRTLDPSISPSLEEIVMTAVAQDPQQRFASALQLGDALEALAATEGHVVGARLLARTIEDVVGPKHAPWIAPTAVIDAAQQPVFDAEPSLVEVIAQTAPESEPIYPTFGPRDERAIEEGSIPSAPVLPTTRGTPAKSRRRWAVVAAIGLAAIGAGTAVGLSSRGGSPTQAPVAVPAPGHPAAIRDRLPDHPPAIPDRAPDHTPMHADEPIVEDPITSAPTPSDSSSPSKPHRHRPKHPTSSTRDAGSAAVVVAPEPPAAGSATAGSAATGSPTQPPNVEWKPTMLLPSDSGSGKNKP